MIRVASDSGLVAILAFEKDLVPRPSGSQRDLCCSFSDEPGLRLLRCEGGGLCRVFPPRDLGQGVLRLDARIARGDILDGSKRDLLRVALAVLPKLPLHGEGLLPLADDKEEALQLTVAHDILALVGQPESADHFCRSGWL